MQLVSARVAAIGAIPPLSIRDKTAPAGTKAVKSTREVWFRETGAIDAAVYDRADARGAGGAGPAIIESLESTILVPPDWQARMTRTTASSGADAPVDATARRDGASPPPEERRERAAPIPPPSRSSRTALYKIAEEMRVVLAKTAYSPMLKSAGDYSCGVFDARGEMVAQGPDLPIHLGSMPMRCAPSVAAFGADVHDGDVFIHNDPYFGGSHLPDVNVVRPAFHEGRLLGYACLRAHWPDVGSATPGSYGAVTEIYGEGLRLPPLRLVAAARSMSTWRS